MARTKSTAWFGIDYNMNIYRGCCHGCIYCDSRSACYQIDHFDTVRAKEDALRIIRDDLRRKVKTGVVGTGAMSDPYNPFEKKGRADETCAPVGGRIWFWSGDCNKKRFDFEGY